MRKKIPDEFSIPNNELLNNCIHCGLCLPTCPTYSITVSESSSPRGRISLIKSLMDGKLKLSREFIYEMNFCLSCLACETACPAGIKYSSLVESARIYIYSKKFPFGVFYFLSRFLTGWTISNRRRLRNIASVIRFFQSSSIFEKFLISVTQFIFKDLRSLWNLMPDIKNISIRAEPEQKKEGGENLKYTVIFLTGCIMDAAFQDINEDTIRLLEGYKCRVIIPGEQTCCGALQYHMGDLATGRNLSRNNIELFSNYSYDYIIANSAGCGSFMKKYVELFKGDDRLSGKAASVASRVMDITEFLDAAGFPGTEIQKDNSLFAKRVTYHDACHLAHAQRVTEQPRRLIKNVRGIEYVELPESLWCCGSAGTYNITHYRDSMEILRRKIDNIKKVRPDILLTGNPGCLIQVQHGLRMEHMDVELMHTATFLRRAYEF